MLARGISEHAINGVKKMNKEKSDMEIIEEHIALAKENKRLKAKINGINSEIKNLGRSNMISKEVILSILEEK